MVETPVLYITFARPEYASQSFAAIKAAKPKKLYFYSNKARDEKPDEVKRNIEVRSFIKEIDWDCEVKTWFRYKYVDVYTSLWGAIDWLFDNEEKGIVIEEDVVASLAFFDYVDQLINKYRNDKNVWMISGNNSTPKYNPDELSYWGSRYIHIFGWASWADRWHKIDKKMIDWPKFRRSYEFRIYWDSVVAARIQRSYYDRVYNNYSTYNPWDFIFSYNMVMNKSYCILPQYNLVADVGVTGVHHNQMVKSVYQISDDLPHKYEMKKEPISVEPTSYDKGHFWNYIFRGLITRKIRKLIHI